jgi:regulator of replication initiation timing
VSEERGLTTACFGGEANKLFEWWRSLNETVNKVWWEVESLKQHLSCRVTQIQTRTLQLSQ